MKFAGVLFTVLAVALISTAAGQNTPTQSPDGGATPREPSNAWILGVWEGAHLGPGIASDTATFEFTREGGTITWKMTRSGVIGQTPIEAEASGVVTKLSETSAELEGKYDDQRTVARARGQSVKYSLTRNADLLEGSALGVQNVYFYVSLKRSR